MLTSHQRALPWGEEEPRQAKPKVRPYRQPYRPRKPPSAQLPILPEGAAYNDETGERHSPPCLGGEGTCLFFRCRHNLVLDILAGPRGESGTIQIRSSTARVTIPLHRSNAHVTKRGDIERAGDIAADVVEWLEHSIGTTCRGDLTGPRSQQAVAAILRVERQRVQQIEQGAARHERLRELAEEWTEEPKPARFTGLVQIRRRGT